MYSTEITSPVCLAMVPKETRKSLVIANKNDIELNFGRLENGHRSSEGQSNGKRDIHGDKKPKHTVGNIIIITLPIFLVVIPTVLSAVAYIMARHRDTLKLPKSRDVPYISDIGDSQPQSSLFTLGLSLSSFCTFAVITLRYFQVKAHFHDVKPWVNRFGFFAGVLITIGKVMVASFQLTGLQIPHYAGAFVYSLSAVFYTVIQTYISHKDSNMHGKRRVLFLIFRGLLSAGTILGFLVFGIFLIPSLVKFNRPGYSMAQAGEWCFAACKMLFMLTFVVDFWKLQPSFVLDRTE